MRNAIVLFVLSSTAVSVSNPGCACGELCDAALREQRIAREVETARYESALASLREQLELERREKRDVQLGLANLRAVCPQVTGFDSTPPAEITSAEMTARQLSSDPMAANFHQARFGTALDQSFPHPAVELGSEVPVIIAPRGPGGIKAGERWLLQDGVEHRACSKAEANAVLLSPDPVSTVVRMFDTNPSCAMCIVPCADKKSNADAIVCIQSCQHQNENRCDPSTGLQRLAPLISNATLGDRDSLLHMILLAESDCKSSPPCAHTA